jgi:hypothetical protein
MFRPQRKALVVVRNSMKTPLIIGVLTSLLSACSSPSNKVQTVHWDTLNPPKDSSTFYFPVKMKREDRTENKVDSFDNQWFSSMLFALHEPVLDNYTGSKEIYRFTWLRTFDHPVTIRVEKQNGIAKMFVKESNGQSGYDPGRLIRDTSADISAEDWQDLIELFQATGFWQLHTEEENMGKDGSEWLIEGVKDGRYRFIYRWSPEPTDVANSIGKRFLRLTKVHFHGRETY